MKTCPVCHQHFDERDRAKAGADALNNVLGQIKYCSERCARKAENQRYYAAHRDAIIERVHHRQKRKKKARKQ